MFLNHSKFNQFNNNIKVKKLNIWKIVTIVAFQVFNDFQNNQQIYEVEKNVSLPLS